MSNNEIISVLKEVTNRVFPEYETPTVIVTPDFLKDVLVYIQQLESDLQLLKNDYEHSKSVAEETVERNQRLREKLMKALSDLKTAKTKAIREFSERLKIKGRNISFCPETTKLNYGVTFDDINDLVTEIVGAVK